MSCTTKNKIQRLKDKSDSNVINKGLIDDIPFRTIALTCCVRMFDPFFLNSVCDGLIVKLGRNQAIFQGTTTEFLVRRHSAI